MKAVKCFPPFPRQISMESPSSRWNSTEVVLSATVGLKQEEVDSLMLKYNKLTYYQSIR